MVQFKKKKLIIKREFGFPLQLLSETFFILRKNEWNMIKKCTFIFMYSTCCSRLILIKRELSPRIFKKY